MIDVTRKLLDGYTFIDLFAGLGGFRLALESFGAKCVYSNEWDEPAQKVYAENFGDGKLQYNFSSNWKILYEYIQIRTKTVCCFLR